MLPLKAKSHRTMAFNAFLLLSVLAAATAASAASGPSIGSIRRLQSSPPPPPPSSTPSPSPNSTMLYDSELVCMADTSFPPARPARPVTNSVVYADGTIGHHLNTSVDLGIANRLAGSGFTTVILGFLHFHPENTTPYIGCSLYWDDNSFCDFSNETVIVWMQALRQPLSTIQRVLVTIGGAGNEADYQAIQENWQLFNESITQYTQLWGFDGYDLDLEADLGGYYDALFNLAALANDLGKYLTIAPCCGLDGEWLQFMQKVPVGKSDTVVSWVNYQLYGDNGFGSFTNAVAGAFPTLPDIVYPGFGVSCEVTPAQMVQDIIAERAAFPTIQGAMLYDFMTIYDNSAAYGWPSWWGFNMSNALSGNVTVTSTRITTTSTTVTETNTTLIGTDGVPTVTTSLTTTTTARTTEDTVISPPVPQLMIPPYEAAVIPPTAGMCAASTPPLCLLKALPAATSTPSAAPSSSPSPTAGHR